MLIHNNSDNALKNRYNSCLRKFWETIQQEDEKSTVKKTLDQKIESTLKQLAEKKKKVNVFFFFLKLHGKKN